jgi:hypothetical protein
MRALPIFLAFTTLLAGAASAAPAATAPAAAAIQPTTQQMQEIEGAYALADGRRAWVFMQDNRLIVEIGRQQKELTMVAQNQFASRDGTVSLRFQPQGHRDDDRIVLNYGDAFDNTQPIRLAAGRQRPGRGGAD